MKTNLSQSTLSYIFFDAFLVFRKSVGTQYKEQLQNYNYSNDTIRTYGYGLTVKKSQSLKVTQF